MKMNRKKRLGIIIVLFLVFGSIMAVGAKTGAIKLSKLGLGATKNKDHVYSTMNGDWEKEAENTYVMDIDGDKTPDIRLSLDGDEWIYEFSVEDKNIDYKVFEDIVKEDLRKKYKSSGSDGNSANRDDPGTITEEYRDGDKNIYTITNKKEGAKPEKTYGINIKKKVSGIKTDRSFSFTIELDNYYDKTYFKGNQIFGDVAFKDGVGKFALKDGEVVKIEGLPDYTEYYIKEEKLSEAWTATDNINGFIQGKDKTIEYENSYTEPVEKKGGFVLLKKVEGNYKPDKAYNFNISFDGLLEDVKYEYYVGDKKYKLGADNPDINVKLKDGEMAVFSNLPEGTIYQISEEGGDYISSYKITEGKNIVKEKDFNSSKKQDLTTDAEVVDSEENAKITFVNQVNKTEDLAIGKKVEGSLDEAEKKTEFMINLYMENLEPHKNYSSDFGLITADESGKVNMDIVIKHDDLYNIKNLPVGAKYRFTEKGNPYVASFVITDKKGKDKIVKAKDSNDVSSNLNLSTELETVDPGEKITVMFVNKKPEKFASIKLIKYKGTVVEEGNKVGPCEYILYQNNMAQGIEDKKIRTIKIGKNGESEVIKDLPTGNYYLIESVAPEDCVINPNPIKFTLSKEHLEEITVIKLYDNEIIMFPGTGNNTYLYITILAFVLITISALVFRYKRGKIDE